MTDKFQLGRVFVSKGAKAALSMDKVSSMLIRHAAGERHVSGTGSQVVSEFAERSSQGQSLQVWVITEPNRTRTLVMLPRETPYRRHDIDFDRTDGVTAEEVPAVSPARRRQPEPVQPSQKPPCGTPNAPVRAEGPTAKAAPRPARDNAYWDETADLVLEYLELLSGAAAAADREPLLDGFIDWMKRSSRARAQYVEGDDMTRAALVERYLKLQALPRE
jgi:hypothetical protein